MNSKKENPFISMLCNIILPVLILNQFEKKLDWMSPTLALVIALLFPLGYGVQRFVAQKKVDAISVIGFVSILLTGGFALLHLDGEWFAIKEAGIPLIIGIAILFSSFTKKPLIRWMILNPNIFKVSLLYQRLEERNCEKEFENHLKTTTNFLGLSFFFSAFLNYVLAKYFFKAIDPSYGDVEKTRILNQQIGDMTFWSYFAISIPSMICMALIVWYLSQGIYKLAGLRFKEIIEVQN